MIGSTGPPAGDILDRFIDGLLDQKAQAAFEQRLGREPALRDEVDRRRAIDAALRRTLGPPPEDALRAIVERALRAGATAPLAATLRFTTATRRLAIAASLALCLTGIWMAWRALAPGGTSFEPYAITPPKSMEVAYADEVAAGFEPAWACADDEEFRETFRRRFGLPLLLDPLPEGSVALGLAYGNTISPWTLHLLARVGDRPVLVLVDRAERDGSFAPPADSGLHLHRRAIEDLVIYELTPHEAPALLEHFRIPGRDAAPSGADGEKEDER